MVRRLLGEKQLSRQTHMHILKPAGRNVTAWVTVNAQEQLAAEEAGDIPVLSLWRPPRMLRIFTWSNVGRVIHRSRVEPG